MAVEPPKLVPDSSSTIPRHPTIPALPKTAPALSELDAAFQKSPLAKEAEEQRLHLEWRQLQNRVAHDPEVVAAKAATTTAKTDLEKRARLRAYYNIYYAHMQALASGPEIRSYLDGKKGCRPGGSGATARPSGLYTPREFRTLISRPGLTTRRRRASACRTPDLPLGFFPKPHDGAFV